MKFSVTSISEDEIKAIHQTEYALTLFIAFFLAMVALLFFLTGRIDWIFAGILLLGFTGHQVWKTRELATVIDKSKGVLWYRKSGVLGTNLNSREVIRKLAEINQLEIQRFAGRGSDSFKIRIVFKSGQKDNKSIYLTNDLSFSEAHQYAEQIHQFLGKEIPLKAVD